MLRQNGRVLLLSATLSAAARGRATCLLVPLLLLGCIPDHYAYLRVPMKPLAGEDLDAAVVVVPLDKVRPLMGECAMHELAFYAAGRSPLPYRLVDDDGDGEPDRAVLLAAVPAEGGDLVMTCPGPRAEGEPPSGDRESQVELDFGNARW